VKSDQDEEETMDTIALDSRLSQPVRDFIGRQGKLLIDGKLAAAVSGKSRR
jgi:hypothetical protein